tara:strand:- start:169 stop:405 length:237 start_codon:yes stop_codon:yes gene_type:complete
MTSALLVVGLLAVLVGVIGFAMSIAKQSGGDEQALDNLGEELDSLRVLNLEMSRAKNRGKALLDSIRARTSNGLRDDK